MSHKAPPSTVFEAIDRSIRQPEIGAGWDATVYPLSGLEREYVLRVRHDDVPKLHTLTTSTTLTPINCGYNRRMVAPPLMLSKALSIHSRQPGKSLNIYWTDLTL